MTLEAPCTEHALVTVVLPVEPPAALELPLLPHALVDHLATDLQHPEAVPRGGHPHTQRLSLWYYVCLFLHFGPELGRRLNLFVGIDSISLPFVGRGQLVWVGSGCTRLFEQG